MIQIIPLGAGQDVGRSCIVAKLGGKTIMLDCGIHMAMQDERKFPDFSLISKTRQFDSSIDCVLITHFHLDHCGALPYFTEHCKYSGPIIMTHPTRAICPILLEDLRKILSDKRIEHASFSSENIRDCMRKVTCINLLESIFLDDDGEFEIRAYYAGHVLGAAMFHVRVGNESIVYTGDFNTTPDRHLGAAWIDRLRPNVFITESTYATTIRDSKRTRERDFLKKIHETILAGGKVLIPTFAVGRAQELFLLLESYLDRSHLDVPVYFSAALTEKANKYYKLFVNWTNQRLKQTFHTRNLFDFRRVKPFERSFIGEARPMILFASPGMLNSGFSLEVLKAWASDSRNLLVIPGYCAPDTVGAKLLAGQRKLDVDRVTTLQVEMKIEHFSFSAHADAKGILQLIGQCEPRNVVLVHGEKAKMTFLREQIERECKVPCYHPANGECLKIDTKLVVPIGISQAALKRKGELAAFNVPFNGVLLEHRHQMSLFSPDELEPLEGSARKHGKFLISTECTFESVQWDDLLLSDESLGGAQFTAPNVALFMHSKLKRLFPLASVQHSTDTISIYSLRIQFVQQGPSVVVVQSEWDYYDNDIADVLSRHLNLNLNE